MEETPSSRYILWLPSWYPNALTPYDGDFIQRHARAVSAFVPVHVFYIIRDKDFKMTRTMRMVERVQGPLTETIFYYASPRLPFAFLDRFVSQMRFMMVYRRRIRKLFRERGLPQLVHVHIVYKAGLIARHILKKWGIPFVLTEQWTMHLEEAKPNLFDLSYAEQHLISRIMDRAEWVLPVSAYLGESMRKHWPNLQTVVVPNVVDHALFYPAVKKNRTDEFKLVHISTLGYQKDPESMFAALGKLKESGIPFRLDLFGPEKTDWQSPARAAGVDDRIQFHGEKPQTDLAVILREADALILYSRYETFGCVLIEANACGIPVVVPDTPLMRELVTEGVNGTLVPPQDPEALSRSLITLYKQRDSYDAAKIAETTTAYAYTTVGKRINDLYSALIDQLE